MFVGEREWPKLTNGRRAIKLGSVAVQHILPTAVLDQHVLGSVKLANRVVAQFKKGLK